MLKNSRLALGLVACLISLLTPHAASAQPVVPCPFIAQLGKGPYFAPGEPIQVFLQTVPQGSKGYPGQVIAVLTSYGGGSNTQAFAAEGSASVFPPPKKYGPSTISIAYQMASMPPGTCSTTVYVQKSRGLTIKASSLSPSLRDAVELTAILEDGEGAATFGWMDGTGKCSLSGSTLTASQPGTCYVTASVPGDNFFAGAASAELKVTFGP